MIPPKKAVHNIRSTVSWRRFKIFLFIINVLLIIDLLYYYCLGCWVNISGYSSHTSPSSISTVGLPVPGIDSSSFSIFSD